MNEKPYDTKLILKTLSALIAIMAICKVSDGSGILVTVPFLLAAMVKRNAESVFFWMFFLLTSVCINSFFLPKGPAFGIIQRGALLLLGLSGLACWAGQRKAAITSSMLLMYAYVIYMIIPSSSGWAPYVSFLKLILFFFIFNALVSTTNSLLVSRQLDVRRLRSIYLAFATLFIFGSLLLIPFPAISQLSGEDYLDAIKSGADVVSLFKGMTVQSQALGPIIVVFAGTLLSDLLFGIRKVNWLYVCLLAICPYLIYKTSSRTAMFSFALICCLNVYLIMRARNIKSTWRTKVFSTAIICAILAVAGVAAVPSFRDGVARYILKYDTNAKMEDVNFETAVSTRQTLMDTAMEDFRKKPILGNGFQVDERLLSFLDLKKGGLILSAPIEKGVWVTAVLQEGGLCGFVLLVAIFINIVIVLFKRHYYIGLSMFATLLLLNMGEFTMFSMSGMGGFIWAMVFVGVVLDESRIRHVNAMSQVGLDGQGVCRW